MEKTEPKTRKYHVVIEVEATGIQDAITKGERGEGVAVNVYEKPHISVRLLRGE